MRGVWARVVTGAWEEESAEAVSVEKVQEREVEPV